MFKSGVRRIGVEKLADPELLQFAQSGKLLGVNDGDDGWRKCHRSMDAENNGLFNKLCNRLQILATQINLPVIDDLLRGHLAQLLEDGTPWENSTLHPFAVYRSRSRTLLSAVACTAFLSLARRQLD